MKKTTQLLAVLLALTLLAGCSAGTGSGEAKAPAAVSTSGTEASAVSTAVSIEESVIFENEELKVTVKSFSADDFMGPTVKLLIENNGSRNLTVQTTGCSVNNYMVSTLFSCDVAAGKKANDSIVLSRSELQLAGIETVADLEFRLHIFNTDTWDTVLDTDPIRLETSAANGYEYTYDASGTEVYNAGGLQIVVKGLSEDGWMGAGIQVYLSNESSKDICVQVRDCSINGFMVDPFFSAEVNQGKHSISTITFLSSELEENGIEAIQDVELSFHIFDNHSWDTILDTDPITIHFD